ncbi:MAG: acetate/propionate family kinase [Massilia sp.]
MTVTNSAQVLTINAGSSSIKFALYALDPEPKIAFDGTIDDIGGAHSRFTVHGSTSDQVDRLFPIPERVTAVNVLVDWLLTRLQPDSLAAISHRVVFGSADYGSTRRVDSFLLSDLYDAVTSDPEHLPLEIHLIEVLQQHFPLASHFACFDSHFHARMAPVASMLAIPRRYIDAGVKRLGFHGLSCAYLMRALTIADANQAQGKVIIAHLGGGASITAIENGVSQDTSMGLTPASGMMMGERTGDIDPGLAWHLARTDGMTAATFNHMVNYESGLIGVSGSSADVRVLLARENHDKHAREAIDLFCYQGRKTICAMAGAIDGMQTLIFTGGIGEHSAAIRTRICAGLSHLGITLDAASNSGGAAIISRAGAAVTVRVMHTDEQWMLADQARVALAEQASSHAQVFAPEN